MKNSRALHCGCTRLFKKNLLIQNRNLYAAVFCPAFRSGIIRYRNILTASTVLNVRGVQYGGIQEIMDRVMAGEIVYPGVAPGVLFGKIKRSDLTERELEVLRELTASLTNDEIAEKLNISANTVKRHLQNIMEKTGFTNRLELAMKAKSLGLVVSDSDRLGMITDEQ